MDREKCGEKKGVNWMKEGSVYPMYPEYPEYNR